VYNGESVIKRCIESIEAQTYENIEIIVVNDGSTDRTCSIVEECKKRYDNLHLINKVNEGLPQARKTGVTEATGEYIGFVDADDWLEPDMYREMYDASQKYQADVVCVGIYEDFENRGCRIRGIEKISMLNSEEALKELHKRKSVFPYAWNKLYKKELFCGIDYPKGNFVGEDYVIVTQILERAEHIVQLAKPFYHYVQTVDSMCRGGYSEKYRLSLENYLLREQILVNKFPAISTYIRNYLLTEYVSFVIAMGKNDNYDKGMIEKITTMVKKESRGYIGADYIDITYKASAIAIMIHYKVLIYLYRIFANRIKKE